MLRGAEAALAESAGTVRRVIYPVVGGEKTLKALAAEAAANEARCKARVRTVLLWFCRCGRRVVERPELRRMALPSGACDGARG
nr:hypothetical protein OH820_23525 [Streptomyces sp. NBC_00857]